MNEFLNPKGAMGAGGVAAIIMTATEVVSPLFGVDPKLCALLLSFWAALVVFSSKFKADLPEKVVTYVFYALVVFTTAWGANNVSSGLKRELIAKEAVAQQQQEPTPRRPFDPWRGDLDPLEWGGGRGGADDKMTDYHFVVEEP